MVFTLIRSRSTGLLDLSGELLDDWTGTLFVEREGSDVYFRGQLDGSAATSDVAWLLPDGFRPGILTSGGKYEYGSGLAWTAGAGTVQAVRINHYLSRFQLAGAAGMTTALNINHHLRTRDAMPTTMPGVKV